MNKYWSDYDLRLRQWCIDHGRPIPGKPERMYDVNWNIPVYQGKWFTGKRDYKAWGKNLQVAHHLNDFETAEDYWAAVKKTAAENLDKLHCELLLTSKPTD